MQTAYQNDIAINLYQIKQILLQRKNTILTWMMTLFVISAVVMFMLPRQYEAKALLMIKPPADLNSNLPYLDFPGLPMAGDSLVLSEVEVLKSRDVIEDVIKDMKLADNPDFWSPGIKPNNPKTALDSAILKFISRLTVKPIGRSYVLSISFRHPDADLSANIANAVVQTYQTQQIASKIVTAHKTVEWLDNQLKTLAEKLRSSARQAEDYRAKENLIDAANVQLTSQQISEISSQLILAQADLAAAQAKQEQLQDVITNRKPLDSVSDILKSRLVSLFKRDEALLHTQRAELQSKYGPKHPKILAIQAELGEINHRKTVELDRVTDSMNNDVLAAKARVVTLQKNLTELETKRQRENQAAIGLRELEREVEANRALYEDLLSRSKKLNAMTDAQQPDSRIVSLARVPSQPSSPSRIIVIAVATLFGMLMGIVWALLAEQLAKPPEPDPFLI